MNIIEKILRHFESPQARYHRECEEAYRRSQEGHDDTDISSKQH